MNENRFIQKTEQKLKIKNTLKIDEFMGLKYTFIYQRIECCVNKQIPLNMPHKLQCKPKYVYIDETPIGNR